MNNSKKKGFTIIELLAAIVIVGILASVASIVINRYILQGHNTVDNQLEKQLVLAAKSYYSDNENATEKLNDEQNRWNAEFNASTTKSYLIIVDDMDELEIFLSPLGTREKQLVRVPLGDFPKRPEKATRITVSFSFTSDSRCHMMVKDKGFGEFFLSSGIVMNEELLL